MSSGGIPNQRDFEALEKASRNLAKHLEYDEEIPNIGWNKKDNTLDIKNNSKSHKYFVVPPCNVRDSRMFERRKFEKIPDEILEEVNSVRYASFMGILPEIHRVWITVDNKLFLWKWNSEPGQMEDYIEYNDIPCGSAIISVTLVTPKSNVFQSCVKYCLVVITATDIHLLTLSMNDNFKDIRISPSYQCPTDDITVMAVASNRSGRIFMAGNDGNLYEFQYTNVEWYLPSLFGMDGGNSKRCKRIKRNSFEFVLLIRSALPPVVSQLFGSSNGQTQELMELRSSGYKLVDVVIDDIQNKLYTISLEGIFIMYQIDQNDSRDLVKKSSFNIYDNAAEWCKRHHRSFEISPKSSEVKLESSGVPKGIFVIPPTETGNMDVLIILSSGLRIYLKGDLVVYVRLPPHPDSLKVKEASSQKALPGQLWKSLSPHEVRKGFYSHGVCLLSLGSSQLGADGAPGVTHQRLVALSSDYSAVDLDIDRNEERAYFTENVSMVDPWEQSDVKFGKRIEDIKEADYSVCHVPGVTSMHPPFDSALLTRLSYASRESRSGTDFPTESASALAGGLEKNKAFAYYGCDLASTKESADIESLKPEPVPGTPVSLPYNGRPIGRGFSYDDVKLISAQGGELSSQIQVSSRKREFLCLTDKGIHIIVKRRPIDFLYDLLTEGDMTKDMTKVSDFFKAYGPYEASIMCIAIACDHPLHLGSIGCHLANHVPKNIQNKAMKALGTGLGLEIDNYNLTQSEIFKKMDDACKLYPQKIPTHINRSDAISGLPYTFSYRHDAFYRIFSRLVRPIWQRQVMRVPILDFFPPNTKPEKVKSKKVPLLSIEDLCAVRRPLKNLMELLENRYPMDVFFDPPTLTVKPGTCFSFGNFPRGGDDPEMKKNALDQESWSLSDLYRLVARSVQALTMMERLLKVQNDIKLEIDWTIVTEWTFNSLVGSSKIQGQVKKLLKRVICSDTGGDKSIAQYLENLSRDFVKDCYFYFSGGERYLALAHRKLEEAEEMPKGSRSEHDLVKQAVKSYCQAAQYWRSTDEIHGTAVASMAVVAGGAAAAAAATGGQSLVLRANNAIVSQVGPESELKKCCERLRDFGVTGEMGVVEVCMTAAANFGAPVSSPIHELRVGEMHPARPSLPRDCDEDGQREKWKRGLFHCGDINDHHQKILAKSACYSVLIQVLREIGERSTEHMMAAPSGGSQESLARIIDRALQLNPEIEFQHMIFAHLKINNVEQLIRLHRPFAVRDAVENFLKRDMDYGLLTDYYQYHGEHYNAMELLSELAYAENDKLRITDRGIQCAENACRDTTLSHQQRVDSHNKSVKLQHELALLKLQEKLMMELKGDEDKWKQLQENEKHDLEYTLIDVKSKLPNLLLRFDRWKIYLELLHIKKVDRSNEDLIKMLWKSVIYNEFVPPDGNLQNLPYIQRELRKRRKDTLNSDGFNYQLGNVTFQSPVWVNALKQMIEDMGVVLQATSLGISVTFPLDVLIEELEWIAALLVDCHLHSSGPPVTANDLSRGHWPFQCLRNVGVSYYVLFKTYTEICTINDNKQPIMRLQLCMSTANLIIEWVKNVDVNPIGKEDLRRAVRSQNLQNWLSQLETMLRRIVGDPINERLRDAVEHAARTVDHAKIEVTRFRNSVH